MATSVALEGGTRVLTTSTEAGQAQQAVGVLVGPAGKLVIEQEDREALSIPPELGRVLQGILEVMAAGGTVTVTSMPRELTTSAAAAVLQMSRPTLMKLIREGALPSHQVGSHTRLSVDDVMAFKSARRERQRAALDALRALEDPPGLALPPE